MFSLQTAEIILSIWLAPQINRAPTCWRWSSSRWAQTISPVLKQTHRTCLGSSGSNWKLSQWWGQFRSLWNSESQVKIHFTCVDQDQTLEFSQSGKFNVWRKCGEWQEVQGLSGSSGTVRRVLGSGERSLLNDGKVWKMRNLNEWLSGVMCVCGGVT